LRRVAFHQDTPNRQAGKFYFQNLILAFPGFANDLREQIPIFKFGAA